jgi:hypothetical protein
MILSALKWFDNKNFISVRSGVLYVTVWMTWLAFDWAGRFAFQTPKDGAEVALIIAAVTAPVTALQMFIFKIYSESRQ